MNVRINGIKIIHSVFNRNKMKLIKFLNIENEMSFMPNLSAIVVIDKAKTPYWAFFALLVSNL